MQSGTLKILLIRGIVGFAGLSAIALGQGCLTVGQAEGLALANRPAIKASMEKVRAARDKEIEMSVSPPLRAEFGYGTHPELGIGNDFLLAVPIDLFGKTRAQWASAHAEYLSAKAALNQEAIDLQTEVFTAYSEFLSAQVLAQSGKELLDLAEKSYAATQQRISTGDLPPNQLLRADLELKKAKQASGMRDQMFGSARRTLSTTLGVSADDLNTLSVSLPPMPENESVEQRPDVAAVRAMIEAAKAEKNQAGTSTSPDFELQVAHDYFDSSGHFTARAQFVWNFFDFGAGRSRRNAAEHSQKSAMFSLKDLEAQAKGEIETAQSNYLSAQEESASYEALIKDAEVLLDKERKAFTLGASSLLDVIDAVRSLRDVQESAADARSRMIASAAKYLAAGGILLGELPKETGK